MWLSTCCCFHRHRIFNKVGASSSKARQPEETRATQLIGNAPQCKQYPNTISHASCLCRVSVHDLSLCWLLRPLVASHHDLQHCCSQTHGLAVLAQLFCHHHMQVPLPSLHVLDVCRFSQPMGCYADSTAVYVVDMVGVLAHANSSSPC
jgi:hypothetical protein